MALITDPTNLDYLITPLRLHIGGNTPPYTYSSDELRTHLVYAVKALAGRWNNRYIINSTTNYAERNPYLSYGFTDPPLIQFSDERAIILQASIDIKGTDSYLSGANAVSWKDDEVSYSNLESVKQRENSLLRDILELNNILPVAGKRLAGPRKASLPGFTEYVGNTYEG